MRHSVVSDISTWEPLMSRKTLTTIPRSWGPRKIWDISSFGTRVAALRLGEGPLFLLADHRPAPSCILIFQVDDLQSVSKELRQKGWKPEGERFEIPEGPCYRFNDPSGNPLALLQITRPNVLGITNGKTE